MEKKKFKSYHFTEYDLSEEKRKYLKSIPCRYICWGEEIYDNGIRLHGYIYFKSQRYEKPVKKILGSADIKPCKYFVDKLKHFRKESKNFVEFGDGPKQGKWDSSIKRRKRTRRSKKAEIKRKPPDDIVETIKARDSYTNEINTAEFKIMQTVAERPLNTTQEILKSGYFSHIPSNGWHQRYIAFIGRSKGAMNETQKCELLEGKSDESRK